MRYVRTKLLFLTICFGIIYNGFAQSPGELYKSSLEFSAKGEFQIAMNYINRALDADSSKTDYVLQKAALCYQLKKYDEAIRYCYAVQRKEPDNPRVFLLRGQIGLTTKSYGGALYLFGKVIKSTNDKECLCNAYLCRGRVYLETEKFTDAMADFNAANALRPDSFEILMLFAEAHVKLNQPEEAIAKIEKVIAKKPKYAAPYKIIGNVYYEKKDFPKALEFLNKFCELNPNDAAAFQTISCICLDNKEFNKALVAVGRASYLDQTNPINFKILANIYFEKGMKDESCNYIFRAFQNGYLEKYGYDLLDLYLKNCEGK